MKKLCHLLALFAFPFTVLSQTYEPVLETVVDATGSPRQVPVAVRLRNLPPNHRYIYDETGTKRLDRRGEYVSYDNGNLVDLENNIVESPLPPIRQLPGIGQGGVGLTGGQMTQVEFDAIIDSFVNVFQPFAAREGALLVSQKLWSSSTVNAFAQQSGNNWIISMHGGIARHPRMTNDGFAYIVCHELGHHFGGFPFYGSLPWAAAEGQADYWAAQTCLRSVWENDFAGNLSVALDFNLAAEHPDAWLKCLHVYQAYPLNDIALCIRTALAAKPLADIDSEIRQVPYPLFNCPSNWGPSSNCPTGHQNPDVPNTIHYHPMSQCRLDTGFSAAVCTMAPAVSELRKFIPGKGMPTRLGGRNGIAAEREAAAFSCSRHFGDATDSNRLPVGGQPPLSWEPWGYRPHCWFKEASSVGGPYLGF